MDISDLKFAATHEWARVEGDVITVGITQFAVDQLTDIVFLELPEVGTTLQAGESFGDIESVKAVSELYTPVDGEVIARNEAAIDDPTRIAADPYGEGWLIRIRATDTSALETLLTQEEYDAHCAAEEQ